MRLCRLLPSLVLALAACSPAAPSANAPATSSSGAASSATEIKVGSVLPLSGAFSASGQYFKQGYELATEEVNTAGGLDVGGNKLQLRRHA